jgi:hypothetical protein
MKLKLMGLLMVAGASLFAQPRFSIGVGIGAPAPVAVAYRPPCPGPGYVWIDGYQDNYGRWFEGYWAAPPYEGAYWIAPRYYGGHFYSGYWGGARYYDRGFRESREHEWREHEWREHEWREREHFDRGRDYNRGREGRRDFRR